MEKKENKDVLISLGTIEGYLKTIKNWTTFFGILTIIALVMWIIISSGGDIADAFK